MSSERTTALVMGGGVSGVTAAIEAAELGCKVYLVERGPSLGGKVVGMKMYFPKLCPPMCGLEINYRRIKDNPNITVLTSTELLGIEGDKGAYSVKVKVNPRYVKADLTDPVTPFKELEATVPNEFNFGMDKKKAVQVPHLLAYPYQAVVDPAALADDAVRATLAGVEGVDLDQEPEEQTLEVDSIIWATGWKPYDASAVGYLKYELPDVVTNLEFERLCSDTGPTQGKLVRPSDGREAKRVGFVQCAGSRDENHLPYCSSICCMASLKHANYVREQYPDAEVYIFYIDIRANRYEDFYRKVQDDEKIHLIKGKPGSVTVDAESGDLTVVAEDMASDTINKVSVDMVVLATGMVPATKDEPVPVEGLAYDEFGFLIPNAEKGIYPAGCVKRPADVAASVQDATGASIKALCK